MPKVVSIVFDGNHKKYYFGSIDGLELNQYVVVETARGIEIGKVIQKEMEIDESDIVGELKSVIRVASEKDLEAYNENVAMKPVLYEEIKAILNNYKELEMKLLEVTYTLDRSKLVIYFTSDGRVDFRELVKDIAFKYHTRIELRQVGPRDASRIISGIGECGRVLCCSEWLGDIQNVTIKMAKNQNLSLNPTTISGLCGKLLCCIAYEDEYYQEKLKELEESGEAPVVPPSEIESSTEISEELKEIIEEEPQKEVIKPNALNKNNNNNNFNKNRQNYNKQRFEKPKQNVDKEEVIKVSTEVGQEEQNNSNKPNNFNNNRRPNNNNNKNRFNNKNNKHNNFKNKNHYKNNKKGSKNEEEETIRIEV